MFLLKKYKTLIIVAVVVVATLAMILFNLRYGSEKSFLKKIVLETVYPAQSVLADSIRGVKDAWMRYILLVGLEQENRNLKKQINELNAVIVADREIQLEAQRLKKLLSITDNHNYRFVTARVIGRSQAALSRSVMIDKGSADGLKNGMPVVAHPGLVGRLVDVSWHVSRVLLLTDENSNVDVIVQRNRTQGIISGAGSRGMLLKYVSKTQDVQKGDVVISAGMGGVFPKGWLIGQVLQVDKQDAGLFLKINIAPFVDFSKLEEVLIISSAIN